MPYKEASIILILCTGVILGSDYRSGFRTRTDDVYNGRVNDINDINEKPSERQEKSK